MRGMIAVISLISGSSSPAAILGCADSVCSTSVVPERGKPRMKIGCGTSVRTPARGSRRSRPPVKKLRRRSICCCAACVQIGLAGQLARQPLALGEGGPGVVVAADLVEQAALFQQFVRAELALVAGGHASRSARAPRRICASRPSSTRAGQPDARDRWGTASPSCRARSAAASKSRSASSSRAKPSRVWRISGAAVADSS